MEASLRRLISAIAVAAAPFAPSARAAGPVIPPAECRAHVGYDRDADFPGYLLPTSRGPKTCIPFAATAVRPPAGDQSDFYVDEFTDPKIMQRWLACKQDPACRAPIERHAEARKPPNREHNLTDPHQLWLLGRPPAGLDIDLRAVRRPAFFTGAHREPISEAEQRTYTVEFTAPAEPYERLELGSDEPVKLRGWYLRGAGIADGQGGRARSLVIISAGGGGRLAAIEHPDDRLYRIDPVTGRSSVNRFPSATSGASGVRLQRDMMLELNRAGFDVLALDRRGVGLSSGYSDTNTLQQGRDLLGVVGALRTGDGMRVLTPSGSTLAGPAAAKALLGSVPGDQLPILFGGISRGTMASGWAMARNFHQACDYDLSATAPCGPPVGYRNIKGAIQLADYTAGPGYQIADSNQDDRERQLFMGATVEKYHVVFFPSSAILASVHTWPALFIGRGLFDYAESVEGSMDAISRIDGLKELVVARAPHALEVWPQEELERLTGRIIAFATAATFDRPTAPGGRPWTDLRSLVATTNDVWEPSSEPKPR